MSSVGVYIVRMTVWCGVGVYIVRMTVCGCVYCADDGVDGLVWVCILCG